MDSVTKLFGVVAMTLCIAVGVLTFLSYKSVTTTVEVYDFRSREFQLLKENCKNVEGIFSGNCQSTRNGAFCTNPTCQLAPWDTRVLSQEDTTADLYVESD